MLSPPVTLGSCLCLALVLTPGCSARPSGGDGGPAAEARPHWVRVEGTFPWRAHAATRLRDGSVLLTGGDDIRVPVVVPERASRQVWRFDPATNRLQPDEPMHYGRQGHGATLLSDGRVLVVGGFDVDLKSHYGQPLALGVGAEIYDPAAAPGQRWRRLPNPTASFYNGLVQQLASGEVFVATGSSTPDDCCGGWAPAEFFDPVHETWRQGSPPSAEYPSWPARGPALPVDGTVLTFGGNQSDAVLRVDPATGLPSLVGRLLARRWRAAAVPLATGQYWVIGGMGASDEPDLSATAERVSLRGSATERVSLDDSFMAIRATRSPSGAALLFGGPYDKEGVLVGLLQGDGTYRRLLRLPFRGYWFTATSLDDGSVLLCGKLEATHGVDVGAVLRFYPGGL